MKRVAICCVVAGWLVATGFAQAGTPASGVIPAQELAASRQAKPPVVVDIRPACYTQAQYRAEQAVRYQTQLMVAGMLCQQANPTSYSQYQAFTQRNTATLQRAEDVLLGFFTEHKTPQPELRLHTLRTDMANSISVKAMQQSLPAYCRRALPRLQEASSVQPRQFEAYLTKLDLKQNSTRPLCGEDAALQSVSTSSDETAPAVQPMTLSTIKAQTGQPPADTATTTRHKTAKKPAQKSSQAQN